MDEVSLCRHNSLVTGLNLYPEVTELTAQSAILVGCRSLDYPRYGLLASNGSVSFEIIALPFLVSLSASLR